VLSGEAVAEPKARDGQVEAIRAVRVARSSAVKAHTAAVNALVGMVRTALEPLRSHLMELRGQELVSACAALRPGLDLADPVAATKVALRRLARRCMHLRTEITDADVDLQAMLTQIAPQLLDIAGCGTDTAAQLLITAGDNPQRVRSEAAWSMLCGVSPVPASSGRTDRHRLNRGGDRQANRALYVIAINRMRVDPATRGYADGAAPRACPPATSSAASSATSPAGSTPSFSTACVSDQRHRRLSLGSDPVTISPGSRFRRSGVGTRGRGRFRVRPR
jgi:transposase